MNLDSKEIPHLVVRAFLEVHRVLGPGLPREAYCECLAREFRMKELVFEQDHAIPIMYKDEPLRSKLTVDFLVENQVIVCVQVVDETLAIHKEAVTNYLKLSGLEDGFLVNFNVADIRKGIKRLILSSERPPVAEGV
ncbi:MAG: GxxExxY protein [Verrucomicrobiota bacterium]